MAETTPTAPDYPVIEIEGRKLIVKFDFLAKFRLSELGLGMSDMRAFRPVDRPEDVDPRVISLICKLFSCLVASNFINRDNPGAPVSIPTPEYWASVVADDMNRWKEISRVTGQALGKAVLSEAAPAPASELDGAAIRTN